MDRIIDEIRYHHRSRCYAMEQRKRADLSLGSFLRMALGWSLALPDADRKRIAEQAKMLAKMGEAAFKGKPLDVEEPMYDELSAIITATLTARGPFVTIEDDSKKEMERLAVELPVWEWAEPIRGFGPCSLATIIAEAGDLSKYPKKGHLWKRMGLAVMGDVRQGGLPKTASSEDWIAHGYNKKRRSCMWNIGECLIKSNGDGLYRQYYLDRKQYERDRAEAAGLTVAPAGKIPAAQKSAFMSEGHIHRRAQRYMEKRLLHDLWRAWRAIMRKPEQQAKEPLPSTLKRAA